MDIEGELGIEATADKVEIRRAYARRLKETHPEDDPEGFQRLRQAYEAALDYAEYMAEDGPQWDAEDEPREDAGDETPPTGVAGGQPRPGQYEPADEAAEPETDQDSGRGRDAVAELAERLNALLDRGDEAGAVEALAAVLADPLLLNLDNRRHFELRLLEGIADREPLPASMAKAAIAAFRWDEQWTNLPGDYQYLADRLLAVLLSEERLAELRRDAMRNWTMDPAKVAARMLLGRYRPFLFNISAGPDAMDAMALLLDELRNHYPSILQNEVDPRVLAWWSEATENRLARMDKRSSRVTWTVISAVVIISAVARMISAQF